MLNRRHAALLEMRGLDVELLEHYGVESHVDRPDWITIPYYDNGQIVNRKHRTIAGDKRFAQDPGGKKLFWNQAAITDPSLAAMPLIITEGEFDALSAIQAGFVRSVSVPDGAPAEQQGLEDQGRKYSYLADAKAILRDVKEIIIASDSDRAGTNLLNDLAIRLGKPRCKWLKYPEGCKDLNDVLQKHDVPGIVQVIGRAQYVTLGNIFRMSGLPPLTTAVPYPIGIVGLDKHYKIRLGDLTVVTGIPSHGKTAFVNEVMCRVAIEHDWTTAVASFEQQPQTDHRKVLRSFHARRLPVYQSPAELAAADRWIDEKFVFIVPDEDGDNDLKWLLDRCEGAIIQYGARLVVIDPWNEIDHLRPPDMSLTEYTGFAIKQFRKLARRLQVHVIVVAHPTKLARGRDGHMPCPTLYDISDSANWANKCDVGIVIFREPDYTQIRVVKTRYSEIGEPGSLQVTYSRDQARFLPVGLRDDQPNLV